MASWAGLLHNKYDICGQIGHNRKTYETWQCMLILVFVSNY